PLAGQTPVPVLPPVRRNPSSPPAPAKSGSTSHLNPGRAPPPRLPEPRACSTPSLPCGPRQGGRAQGGGWTQRREAALHPLAPVRPGQRRKLGQGGRAPVLPRPWKQKVWRITAD
ncbi:unnamed protein product, partial [Urochloa humidicola]